MQTFTNLQFTLDANARYKPINSEWKWKDYLGALKVRSTLRRNNYMVEPGLYAIGNPNETSEVLVSANYKLSFDLLRKNLKGLNIWIMVLDTKGVNVWCAAGKGTFGTEELINRIGLTGIKNRINHQRIIVPQLGAPGIEAHKVKQKTGLKVNYGPVRAQDIKAYLNNKLQATPQMRQVQFNLADRLLLTPVEIVYSSKYLLLSMAIVFLLSGFQDLSFSIQNLITFGIKNSFVVFAAFASGTFLGPVLLPILPFRSLALKGLFAGTLVWLILFATIMHKTVSVEAIAFLFATLALGSFFTMNFTGATTYTSLSGVQKEMKFAIPAQIAAGIVSVLLLIISKLM